MRQLSDGRWICRVRQRPNRTVAPAYLRKDQEVIGHPAPAREVPPNTVHRRHLCIDRTTVDADTCVVLKAADDRARRARRGADVGAAPAGGNTAQPDHAALPDHREARGALRTYPAPTRRVMDDVGQTGKNIRVRAALTVEVGGLSSIVLQSDGYASAVDRADSHVFHHERRRMRTGSCDCRVARG